MNRHPAFLAFTLAAVFALSACTVVPPRVSVSGPSMVVWAPVPPPPPRVEIIPPPPRRDYVWLPGYWNWEAIHHRWVEGHWESGREHERWVPHRWDEDGHGQWQLSGGYWHRG